MGTFKDLTVYKKAFAQAMEIFHISKEFPPEEKYSLTDQIRRSSRSICVNLAEAYRKRQYEAHFVSKLSDCDAENSETQVWLDFAHASHYINNETYQKLYLSTEEIGRLLNDMLANPKKYIGFLSKK
ncbi:MULTISPECIES: four helix bundle protein [Phnomibacter]|uniref:Four helix bundle protein n=1 Tax=Phnomibacter ginsenosidimutans TaxID=2676868 RepID=A0A6I6GMF7_9BACT|nr:four helix bundle protein [Phnomibacter ginsenosidimutans]MCA0382625.1 four helix bundle protein [Bacteroidota bacterium]QGW29695.1 four helix bundle protein [Phnomibacter ginsenosidimutans]